MLGSDNPLFILYLPRLIPLEGLNIADLDRPAQPGELCQVMQSCSNDWRKIFSTYAKIIHATLQLNSTWQDYRDKRLLQPGGNSAIEFSSTLRLTDFPQAIHLIGGKSFAKSFEFGQQVLHALEGDARVHYTGNTYQPQYFDYRSFPNILIDKLVLHLHAPLAHSNNSDS